MRFHQIPVEQLRAAPGKAATVVNCRINFLGGECADPADLARELSERLVEGHSLAPIQGRPFGKAGFLTPSHDKNHVSVPYIRESSIKFEQVVDGRLEKTHLRGVSSQCKVTVDVVVQKSEAVLRFFGGKEDVVTKAKNATVASLKRILSARQLGFRESELGFTPEQMRAILDKLDETQVKTVHISPGESRKLRDFTIQREQRGEVIPPELRFDAHLIARGFNIKIAPLVKQIINESGVQVNVIECTLPMNQDHSVYARVDSSGRILIRVPNALAPTDEAFNGVADRVRSVLLGDKVVFQQQTQLYAFANEQASAVLP